MHHTADEFLKAIEAEPGDRARRLVFADWLDEHAQPERAELIRVEEEMRALPAFADRFWELKPRRNDLRARVGAEWCGKMRYGTECEPVFRHGIPDGWRERWRLIREFTERWHRLPMGDVGGRQAEVEKAERRLGRKLPPSVREWVAFAQDAQWVTGNNAEDRFDFDDVPDQAALSLLLTARGGLHWGVWHSELKRLDPIVHSFSYSRFHGQLATYEPNEDLHPPRVTEFALRYALTSTSGHTEGTASIEERDPFVGEVIAALPVHAQCGALDIYESDNLLIAFGCEHWRQRLEVWIKLNPSLKPEDIPTFLWDFANRPSDDDDVS